MEEEVDIPLPQRDKIKSIVARDWGRSVVYDVPDPDQEEEESSSSEGSVKVELMAPSRSFAMMPLEKTESASDQGDASDQGYKLNFFDSAMMAVILESSIMQMQILARCNNTLMLQKAELEVDEMERARFGVPDTPESRTMWLNALGAAEMWSDRFKLEKFENDRETVTSLLQQTFMELLERRSFSELERTLRRLTEERQLLAAIEAENAALKQYHKSLNKDLRQRRVKQKTATYDADVLAAQIEDKLEDAALNADIQSRYAERWEAARTEQADLQTSRTEARPAGSIELSKRGCDHEQRINGEIELAYTIAIEDGLKKIEEWMDKYEQDSEAIDLQLRIRKSEYQTAVDDRVALEVELEKRGKLMADWTKFKTDRQTRLDWEAKMKKSAVSIQAWWRGLLVRKCLGPYKVKKKKGQDDKKKKK